jgi:transcriptional regulator with XRE-family HTH domain
MTRVLRPSKSSRPTPVLVQRALGDLGRRMVYARKARQWTQADLARMADVGMSTVAALESGSDGVSLGNVCKMLDALGLLSQVEGLLDPQADAELTRFALRALETRR